MKVGGSGERVWIGQELSSLFVRGGLHWTDLVYLAFVIFLSWTLVIMTGFLAVILARTLLIRSKFAGGLAVIFFFVINFVIERIYDLIYRIPALAALPALEWNIWDTLFYVVICLLLFGASGVLAERKLSVCSNDGKAGSGAEEKDAASRYPWSTRYISSGSWAVKTICFPVMGWKNASR